MAETRIITAQQSVDRYQFKAPRDCIITGETLTEEKVEYVMKKIREYMLSNLKNPSDALIQKENLETQFLNKNINSFHFIS